MEGLNPALNLCLELRRSIEAGESLKTGLQRYARLNSDFAHFCRRWLEHRERGGDHLALISSLSSSHRRALMLLSEKGLQGEPIQVALTEMEREIERACLDEIDRHLAVLPFRMMIPLLLMLFPAMMILILAPLLDLLSQTFAQ